MDNQDIYITKISEAKYPETPFDPPKIYPEFQNCDFSSHTDESNEIYNSVRKILYNLGFDSNNFGTPTWNPFKNFISQNDNTLVFKTSDKNGAYRLFVYAYDESGNGAHANIPILIK